MSVKLFSYNNGSASAKALRDALGIKMLAGKGKWRGKVGDKIINWGNSKPFDRIGMASYVNSPEAIGNATNKLSTHRILDGQDYAIPFLEGRKQRRNDLVELMGKHGIVCRTVLQGHSGAGIVIAEKFEDIVEAPLYTRYIPKKDEYRIHVMNGEIIDVQRKARKHEVEDEAVNWKVRNLDGGFIFARNGIVAPVDVRLAAIDAVERLGLVHGAVDVGWHGRHGASVYEVNTACGLAGSTLQTYALAFAKLLNIPQHKLNLPMGDEYVPVHPDNLEF